MGIIDILQEYTLEKKLENIFKVNFLRRDRVRKKIFLQVENFLRMEFRRLNLESLLHDL
jgi:hypothetical protein